ncbi:MAG: deoxyhypusine synthase family protein, partial [Planctomycetota bacterium]
MIQRGHHDESTEGLSPLESLDLDGISGFPQLLEAMKDTAFSGRKLGEAYEVMLEMARDEDCDVILTISGAMTVAKQGTIICDMIDRGLVKAVVATGALIAHGLTESIGLTHYRMEQSHSDGELYSRGFNRIYDTVELESNLNQVEQLVRSILESSTDGDKTWSSAEFCRAVGEALSQQGEGRGILRSAWEQDVPVFIPAFTDSEIGLDFSTWAMKNHLEQLKLDPETVTAETALEAVPPYNPFLDLQEYARLAGKAERLGIFTIGGGVPRNWAQQVAPYYEIANERLSTSWKQPRFQYGVRICPEPVHLGGLSGCTFSEGVSWGKFRSEEHT